MAAEDASRICPPFATVDAAEQSLGDCGYIVSREVAVVAFLAGALGKPLLLEGPAGVGKTELAKAVSRSSARPLLRLQCYEGLDESRALYEWEYGKQLLYTQLLKDALSERLRATEDLTEAVDLLAGHEAAFFHERFLLSRPLLTALSAEAPVVLLIDEVDRSDPEFEALLLEVLSDFQVTIPELGTRRAAVLPYVVLTSNGTREMTEALRRRCLHLHLDYPDAARELQIVRSRVPDAPDRLLQDVVAVTQAARTIALRKTPSVSESIDWARALLLLGAECVDPELLGQTLGVLAKHREDTEPLQACARTALGSRVRE